MAHESTVEHESDMFECSGYEWEGIESGAMGSGPGPIGYSSDVVVTNGAVKQYAIETVIQPATVETISLKFGRVNMFDRQNTLGEMIEKQKVTHQSSVPHLFAETPKVVTHHHDTDDEDTDHSDDKTSSEEKP